MILPGIMTIRKRAPDGRVSLQFTVTGVDGVHRAKPRPGDASDASKTLTTNTANYISYTILG